MSKTLHVLILFVVTNALLLSGIALIDITFRDGSLASNLKNPSHNDLIVFTYFVITFILGIVVNLMFFIKYAKKVLKSI